MKFTDDSEEERREPHTGEWLSLSLRRDPPSTFRDAESQSSQAPKKIFSCNYCMRKFYSSQALGGHQNAHKRERGAIRRYQSQGVMTMKTFPINTTMIRSLSVQAHSLAHKPGREQGSIVAKFNKANTMSQMEWQNLPDETMNLTWPGSFRLEQQPPHQYPSSPTKLDLNLKL